jgi:hypothetical protein
MQDIGTEGGRAILATWSYLDTLLERAQKQ